MLGIMVGKNSWGDAEAHSKTLFTVITTVNCRRERIFSIRLWGRLASADALGEGDL